MISCSLPLLLGCSLSLLLGCSLFLLLGCSLFLLLGCSLSLLLGCDASLSDFRGRCVSEEVYEGRGKLVFGNRYRVTDLPGLWAAGKFSLQAHREPLRLFHNKFKI